MVSAKGCIVFSEICVEVLTPVLQNVLALETEP